MIRCAVVAWVLCCASATAVEPITKPIGSIFVLKTDAAHGWDVQHPTVSRWQSDDGRVCIVGTGSTPGQFIVKGWASKEVNGVHVPYPAVEYVLVVTGDGPNPPIPPGPPDDDTIPPDVPNKMGLGHMAYRTARATGDRAKCGPLADIWRTLNQRVTALKGLPEASAQPQVQAAVKDVGVQYRQIVGASPGWATHRSKLSAEMNRLQGDAGWTDDEWIAVAIECETALRAAAR